MKLDNKNMKKIMFLIVFAILMLWLSFNYNVLINIGKFIIDLLMPIIIGIAIAFILNLPMRWLEEKIFNIKKRKHKKFIRALSLILSIIFILGILILILFLVIPEFVQAIINMTETIPKSYDWINKGLDKIEVLYPQIEEYVRSVDIKNVIDKSVGTAGDIVSFVITLLTGLVSKTVVFFISFIIAIYILADKEKLIVQVKRTISAFFGKKVKDDVVLIAKLVNKTFSNFFTGQCLDAALIGFLLFVVLTILKLPYAIILGVLFTVTALIPYIGGFITLFIGIILIGVINPIGALWYVIVFIALQQLDENFTHPRIVGGSVGLPALWSLVAVLIGGSLFGFIGMIISIPIVSILYSLLKGYVNEKLEKTNLDKE